MNKTFFILGLVLLLVFSILRSIRYIHMFQLNSYVPSRLIRWYKRNFKSEYDIISIFHGALIIFLAARLYFAFFIITLLISITALYKFKNRKEKKKLVYTARVKRLLVTQTFLMILLITLIVLLALNENIIISTIIMGLLVLIGELKIAYPIFANTVNLPMEKSIQQYYYNDAKRILKSNPNLVIIGVTGSYGKTSSKYILTRILAEKYNTLMTPGSYNTLMGVVRTIREQLKPIHEVFVVEMGAKNKGDIKEICDLVHPKYGLITSVGAQHLETFKNIDNIINTKFELIDALPEDGKAFLNYDNDYVKDKSIGKIKVRYGVKSNDVDYRAENIEYGSRGAIFDLIGPNELRIKLSTKLLGLHNVLNIVGACSIALELGVPKEKIKRAVSRLEPIPHRLEIKRVSPEYIIIDDAYNSNPEGAREAFSVLNNFEGYTKILVTPGLIELGVLEDKLNYNLGCDAAKVFDEIILVGRKKAEPIYEGIKDSDYNMEHVYVADNFNEALVILNQINVDKKVILFENDLPDNYEQIK